MLDFFRIAKSTYFYTIKTFNRIDNDKAIKDLIKAIFNENKARYGYRRITLELKNRGYQINHKKVKRLMKMLGLLVYNQKLNINHIKGKLEDM